MGWFRGVVDGDRQDAGGCVDARPAGPCGAAAGAKGNGWNFYFRRSSTYRTAGAQARALSVDVNVGQSAKRAWVTFMDGVGKFADLKKALEADRAFSALWDVSVDPASTTNTCVAANNALTVPTTTVASPDAIQTGYTMIALEASFSSSHVQTVYGSALFDDILRQARGATRANVADNSAWSALSGVDIWRDRASIDSNGNATGEYAFGNVTGPLQKVRFEIRTSDLKYLPASGDRVIVTKGTAADNAIAQGYDDTEPTPNPNSLTDPYLYNNASSTTGISISRSSSVRTPTG